MKWVGVSTHWNDWRQGVATEEIKPLDGKVAFSVSLVPHRRHNFTTPTQSITPTNLLSYFDSVHPLCLCTWDKSKLIIWEMIQRQLIVIFFFFCFFVVFHIFPLMIYSVCLFVRSYISTSLYNILVLVSLTGWMSIADSRRLPHPSLSRHFLNAIQICLDLLTSFSVSAIILDRFFFFFKLFFVDWQYNQEGVAYSQSLAK